MKMKKLIKLIEILNNEKCHIFFRFSGHVNKFDISIHLGGWKEEKSADFNKYYKNNPENIKSAYYKILDVIDIQEFKNV